ncbi:hypothetical protein STEG23_031552, partial [Scotinomys teguina]
MPGIHAQNHCSPWKALESVSPAMLSLGVFLCYTSPWTFRSKAFLSKHTGRFNGPMRTVILFLSTPEAMCFLDGATYNALVFAFSGFSVKHSQLLGEGYPEPPRSEDSSLPPHHSPPSEDPGAQAEGTVASRLSVSLSVKWR